MSGSLLFTRRGPLAFLTINRPHRLNAIDQATLTALSEAVEDAVDNTEIRVLIITGAGQRAFCGGFEAELLGRPQPAPLAACGKPTIAAINGLAYDEGLELALQCDLRLAAEPATFALKQVRRARVPGYSGTQRLPRLIPRGLALELLLTGDTIGAPEALRWGLVHQVVSEAQFLQSAESLGQKIAARPPELARVLKEAVYRGADLPFARAQELESHLADLLRTVEEFREG